MTEWEWVAALGVLCGMLAIWTKHKQEMAKIAKGLTPKKRPPIEPVAGLLIGGSVMLGTGAAILLGSFWAPQEYILGLRIGGLVTAFIGMALTACYFALKPKK